MSLYYSEPNVRLSEIPLAMELWEGIDLEKVAS